MLFLPKNFNGKIWRINKIWFTYIIWFLYESSSSMHPVLRDVAAAIGDKGKVIKINVDKNNELAQALRIKGLPTLMIYKSGEMMWRQSGEQDANTLINLINEFI